MPKNTRVGRCIRKITKKYGYSGAMVFVKNQQNKIILPVKRCALKQKDAEEKIKKQR
jgi:hypothetical protein